MNKSIACILLIFSGIVQAQVNLDDARLLLDSGAVIVIDIRERNEHVTGVAKGMKLIPMSILDIQLTELLKDPKQNKKALDKNATTFNPNFLQPVKGFSFKSIIEFCYG